MSSVGIKYKYVCRYQTIFLPSISIAIEISGHEMLSWGETFQTLLRGLVDSRNVNKYGVSALAVGES